MPSEIEFKKYIRTGESRSRDEMDFYDCVRDIAENPQVQKMKKFPHHGNSSCYQHCLNVAFYNYRICKFFGLDARSAARAGMIHDLFLYDWHTHAKRTGDHFHGMTHPKAALKNAEHIFKLNHRERDIILNHMWPVTLRSIPRTKEGWVTTFTDKMCGALETGKRKRAKGY
ncbi:MAG: phosphohydrolase [Lachnospiraceae bacterium]